MVSRGRFPRTEKMEQEVSRLLFRRGSLGFTELLDELNRLPEDKRIGSPGTLSHCLKSLARAGTVEREIETRKWNLTSLGRLSLTVHEQLSDPKLKERKTLFLVMKETKPDAWWEIVEGLARSTGLHKRFKDLPEEEVMKKLKAYTQQTQHAMTRLWWGIASDMILQIGSILAGILLLRSVYPVLMERDSASRLTTAIRSVVTPWGMSTSQKIEQLIAPYALNLEVLVAWDKAIRDGKFSQDDRTLAFPEIAEKLKALGYLAPQKE